MADWSPATQTWDDYVLSEALPITYTPWRWLRRLQLRMLRRRVAEHRQESGEGA